MEVIETNESFKFTGDDAVDLFKELQAGFKEPRNQSGEENLDENEVVSDNSEQAGNNQQVGSQKQEKRGVLYNNENKAYQYLWNNSVKTGLEHGAFITNMGVLVLPIVNNEHKATDFFVLPTRKNDGNYQVLHNGQWLNILATVHTHPNGEIPYGSDFYPPRWGMGPSFIIGPQNVWVAFRQSNGFEDTAIVMTNKQLLYGGWPLIKNLKNVPK